MPVVVLGGACKTYVNLFLHDINVGYNNCFEAHYSDIDLFNYVSLIKGTIRFRHTCQQRRHHVRRQELSVIPDEDVISGFLLFFYDINSLVK